MMNEKLLQNYPQEVLNLFKDHYKKLSAKDLNIAFKTVLIEVFNELGITQFRNEEIVFLENWYNNIHHQDFISHLLSNKNLNEIIFHSHEVAQLILHEQKEKVEILGLTAEDFQLSFEIFALKNNVAWNFSEPFASFTAQVKGQEFRATLIHHSTSANRKSKIFLRSIQKSSPTLDLFDESPEMMDFIKNLMMEKKNILISGGTGSGKTTFMRALLNEIPKEDHVIVLEDTHEIMTFSPHQTSLLSQQELTKKSLKDYCAYALRMSPDRLIVGEMRSTEVVPFMLAMNTGHKGLMSTIHANSCGDALSRIALLFSLYAENKEIDFNLITKLACKNIDYVFHMKNKKILEIAHVLGSEGETPYFEMIHEGS